jgi:hypothetical protein
MQSTNISSNKASDMVSKVIAKLMYFTGIVALVWLLIFLLVAMIDK